MALVDVSPSDTSLMISKSTNSCETSPEEMHSLRETRSSEYTMSGEDSVSNLLPDPLSSKDMPQRSQQRDSPQEMDKMALVSDDLPPLEKTKTKKPNRKKFTDFVAAMSANQSEDPASLDSGAGSSCQSDRRDIQTDRPVMETPHDLINANEFGTKKKRAKKKPWTGECIDTKKLPLDEVLEPASGSVVEGHTLGPLPAESSHDENKENEGATPTVAELDQNEQLEEKAQFVLNFGKKKKPSSKNRVRTKLDDSIKASEDDLYTYDTLLKRLGQMVESGKEKQQETFKTEKVKIPFPQVIKSGRMRTSFVNFAETASRFHRPPSHLLAFMNSELGTTCTVCSTNQLWIKGNFKGVHIEKILRQYAKVYVVCPACRCGNTMLTKEARLSFIACDSCQAKFSVPNISNGYRSRVQIR